MSFLDFVPISKLGEGSFGTVYKVRRLTDQKIYAMKKVNIARLDGKAKNSALNQVRILASLDSQFIVRYCQAFFEEKLDMLCIVMQYADGGDLSTLIKDAIKRKNNVKQIQIWSVMIQLLKGLKCMHSKGILHRDLKTQNIFLFNEQNGSQRIGRIVKIGDLNVSKVTKNSENIAVTQTGTPYYASPQIWDDKPYDQKTDVWALGCILYELATLRVPFQGKDMNQLYKKVKSGRIREIPNFYSKQLNEIIKSCLRVDSSQRASVEELLKNFTVRMYGNLLDLSQKNQQQVNAGSSKKETQKASGQYKQFLKTINMPSNKRLLKNQLPKANYQLQINSKLPQRLTSNFQKEEKAFQIIQKFTVTENSQKQQVHCTEPDLRNQNKQDQPKKSQDDGVTPKTNKRRSLPKTQKPVRKHQNQSNVEHQYRVNKKQVPQHNYQSPLDRYIKENQKRIASKIPYQKIKESKKDNFDKIYSEKLQSLLSKKLCVELQKKNQAPKPQNPKQIRKINQQIKQRKRIFNQPQKSKLSNEKQNTPIKRNQNDKFQCNTYSYKKGKQQLFGKAIPYTDHKKFYKDKDIPKPISSLQMVFQSMDIVPLKRAKQNILLSY